MHSKTKALENYFSTFFSAVLYDPKSGPSVTEGAQQPYVKELARGVKPGTQMWTVEICIIDGVTKQWRC